MVTVIEECRSMACTTFMAARASVAEVVQADGRQPGLADDLVEPLGDIGRMQRAPVRLREQQPAVDPIAAESSLVRVLARDVLTQDEDGVRVDRDDAFR
ncbi:hypothetical protein [Amycolatopsis speibonae]|uniref:Uncharacterized protein n=1 Tax=Amycolatopsis speibonae TaxID=1450224 RepID=A0ABV7P4R9_9PSEU